MACRTGAIRLIGDHGWSVHRSVPARPSSLVPGPGEARGRELGDEMAHVPASPPEHAVGPRQAHLRPAHAAAIAMTSSISWVVAMPSLDRHQRSSSRLTRLPEHRVGNMRVDFLAHDQRFHADVLRAPLWRGARVFLHPTARSLGRRIDGVASGGARKICSACRHPAAVRTGLEAGE